MSSQLGMTFTMGNPGADTRSSFMGTVDNMIIYENQGLPSIDFTARLAP